MSVNISVSDDKNTNCYHIIRKFFECKINSRIIDTTSVVNNKVENGCLITLGPEYNTISKVNKVWSHLSNDYDCAHLKIDGLYDGCILNYINADYCPG